MWVGATHEEKEGEWEDRDTYQIESLAKSLKTRPCILNMAIVFICGLVTSMTKFSTYNKKRDTNQRAKKKTSSEGLFKFPILWFWLNDIDPKIRNQNECSNERYKIEYEMRDVWFIFASIEQFGLINTTKMWFDQVNQDIEL